MNAKHSFNKWHISLFHAHVIALYLCRCRPIISVGPNVHLFRDRQTTFDRDELQARISELCECCRLLVGKISFP